MEELAERRAVFLFNPGLKHLAGATQTLYAAIQMIQPGEVARAHRHTPSALRFIIEGEGAMMNVEGEVVPVHEGDLVLTPNWLWHEHRNEGTENVTWLDGLDSPFVFGLNAAVYEMHPDVYLSETKPRDVTSAGNVQSLLRPVALEPDATALQHLVYRWSEVEPALTRLAAMETTSSYDGVAIEYAGPNNGHALRTMSCWMQMLRSAEHTAAHRHTHSSVYLVHRGSGHTVIDGQRFDWKQGDCFVIPSWTWHEHVNDLDTTTYLFSMNDIPIMEAFDLQREESLTTGEGHQSITSTFDSDKTES
jgi:gentisate 1,2-dioxygenase